MLSLVRVAMDGDCRCLCLCCPSLTLLFSILTSSSEFLMIAVELFTSFIVVPERYDIKPGSIGRIHGDKKDAKPAPAETRTLVSNTIISHTNLCQQSINIYFQISSKSSLATSSDLISDRVNIFVHCPPRRIPTINIVWVMGRPLAALLQTAQCAWQSFHSS